MAFFRVRRHSITLVHGEQDSDFGVRHRRLYAFAGLDDLRHHMEPENWARLSVRIEQNHPDLALNWSDLRAEATELLERKPSGFEERKQALFKQIRKLRRTLPRAKGEEDKRLLNAIGQRLGGLIRQAYGLYLSFDEDSPENRMRLIDALFPDAEAVAEQVEEARDHYRAGQVARGRRAFEVARKMDPFDPDIDYSEGVALLERKKLAEAEQLFERARKLAFDQLADTKKSYSWYQHEVRPYLRATCNLGIVKERQGKLNEALALFQECVNRCPNDGLGARFYLAPIHQRLGNLHQAIALNEEHCRGSLVDGPDAFYDLASALFQLGRTEEAIRNLLEGIRINSYVPHYLLLKKSPTSPSDYASVDSLDWALTYCQNHRDLWPERAKALLRAIWKDAELQRQVKETCGRCSVCLGAPLLPLEYDRALEEQARVFLSRQYLLLRPKQRIPTNSLPQYGLTGALPAHLRHEIGYALVQWGHGRVGRLTREGKRSGHFDPWLAAEIARCVRENGLSPAWVTCVPSLANPQLVPALACEVALQLGLEFRSSVRKVRANEPQKSQENSFHQCRNLDGVFAVENVLSGPVLLIDDAVDSGWTFTLVSVLLLQAGVERVYPIALASTAPAND